MVTNSGDYGVDIFGSHYSATPRQSSDMPQVGDSVFEELRFGTQHKQGSVDLLQASRVTTPRDLWKAGRLLCECRCKDRILGSNTLSSNLRLLSASRLWASMGDGRKVSLSSHGFFPPQAFLSVFPLHSLCHLVCTPKSQCVHPCTSFQYIA